MQETTRLRSNFISLMRAVDSIASCLHVADAELDARRPLNRGHGLDPKEAELKRWSIRQIVAKSRAASRLLPLLNQPLEDRPTWFESKSGFAIRNDAVGVEGLNLLLQIEKLDLMSVRAVVPGLRQLSQSNEAIRPDESSRLMQVGFDINDLIVFLNASGVAHALGDPSETKPAASNSPGTELVDSMDSNVCPAISPASASQFGGQQRPKLIDGNVSPKRQFRGILADVLATALAQAKDPNSYRSVFAALRELARSEDPPIPLLGYNAADDLVLWNNGDTSNPKAFGLEQMKSRMRNKKQS